MMKKYCLYRLVADFGEVNEGSESYREMFCKYHKTDAPKTLYGIDEQGSISVIMSRG